MTLYSRLLWPALRALDPERSHDLALRLLEVLQSNPGGRALLRRLAGRVPERPVERWGLRFVHPVGAAAGLDKDARVVPALAALGFSHVEVGTVTPRPQPGNPRPRVFRLPADRALINRLGFPSRGVENVARRLAAIDHHGCVIGVSLGKQRETALADAAEDYLEVMRGVYPAADYLAVNLSSPNTPGLRELQGEVYLRGLLARLVAEGRRLAVELEVDPRPLLVKIAPELEPEELAAVLTVVEEEGADGIIATNTTVVRQLLRDPRAVEEGGLSGAPLRGPSTAMVEAVHRQVGHRLTVVGVGGVASAGAAAEKLAAGASLVQLYTGLVYEGPGLVGRIVRGL
jgi:dihydroorotate dehydrogenase